MKMPDVYLSSQKGVQKLNLSLLKQRRDENTNPTPGIGQSNRKQTNDKQPVKRPLHDTYKNTLEAAKRLKLVNTTLTRANNITEPECELLILPPSSHGAMLNGHHAAECTRNGGAAPRRFTPVASLTNLGNTCFLNSVLYTLRYAPKFLHNLHHLAWDLAAVDQKLGSIRLKSSSLGRGAAGLAAAGARSWSSKDLLLLSQTDSPTDKSKIQIVTERLHETFVNLRALEIRCHNNGAGDNTPEPYAAESFLSALREVNSTFEGNRQQDAHELLVCILDNIRETCQALRSRAARLQHENGDSNGIGKSVAIEAESKAPLGNLRKSWKKKKEAKSTGSDRVSPTEERISTLPSNDEDLRTKPGWDFVSDYFEGMTALRTTCVECETVTERKQAMCDICVPVCEQDGLTSEQEGEPLQFTSTECLRDQNKYWCETCLRYNEARRTIAYESLPHLLVLQLKRFSGGMEKITKHYPTPLELSCFCESCTKLPRPSRPHSYTLWAIIMHLGQALSGGHYMAYVKHGVGGSDSKCSRENCGDSVNTGGGGSFMRNFFNRPRPQPSGCTAKDCCAPKEQSEPMWLVCDDDLVKPVSQEEFDDILSPEPKLRTAATPYLLFYLRNDASEVG